MSVAGQYFKRAKRSYFVLIKRGLFVCVFLFIQGSKRLKSFCFKLSIWRCFTISKSNELLMNEEIRDKEVRLVGNEGEQLGIMSAKDAYKLAMQQGLDLVKIAPQATPPVCKIMDYGKYRYEQAKREKEARKNQKVVEIKEVRMSLNIDVHDFETKVSQAKKFLKAGDKVKVSVRYRGREMARPELGKDLLERFKDACSEEGIVDKPAKMEGRSLAMFIASKTNK